MAFPNKKQTSRRPNLSAGRRNNLNTYYRGTPGPETKSPFEKKPTARKVRGFLFGFLDLVILGILLALLVYSLLLRPHPRLIISSTAYHKTSDYQLAADKDFASITNRNKLTFDEARLVSDLKKQFPEISDASVELPFFSETPTLRLFISKPSLSLEDGTQNLVIDANGVVAGRSAAIRNSSSLPKLIDQSGFKSVIGQPALSSSDVSFIRTLVLEMGRAKVPIASLVLPAAAEELDLHASDQPYYVKFFLGGDVLRQSGQFLAARHSFQQQGQPPATYLDVRVPGRIFYK